MSLRHGLTADEFKKLERLVEKGTTWEDIVEHQNDGDKVPHFLDVDMAYVKKHIYEPMLKTRDLKKKVGAAIQKQVETGKKWADILPSLPKELSEDAEHIRKFIYAPARQKHASAEKAKAKVEAE